MSQETPTTTSSPAHGKVADMMNSLRPVRYAIPTTVAMVVVLVAALMTASYRMGTQAGALSVLPDEFGVIAEIYAHVQAEAVQLPGDAQLAEGAARGLLAALQDPYAAYYNAENFAHLTELLDGTFTGVGLMLEERPGPVLEVVNVIEGGPAAGAGVVKGERIVSVDGESMVGKTAEEVVSRVRGPEGSTVRVGLDGPLGPRELTMTRAVLELPVLETELLPDGTGLVELIEFPQDIGTRVRSAVDALITQGATGIVLDLRGNPGGLLDEAVSVASVFINEGPIVSVKERERDLQTFAATGKAFTDVPLVVLVDNGTASASEIVAAAVQDRGRGRVVGTKTFGKGTVQVVRSLPSGAGMKFTIAEYLTPSGASIEGVGVAPDVVAEGTPAEQLAAAQREVQGAPALASR